MGRLALAWVLVPSVALGAEPVPVEPAARFAQMSAPELFAEYETIDASRPRLGWPIALTAVSVVTGLIAFGIGNAVSRSPTGLSGLGGAFAVGVMVSGAVNIAASLGWLVATIVQRFQRGAEMNAVQDELDARERRQTELAGPELLALLSSPPPGPTPPSTGGLVVVVTDGRGPVQGATVTVRGQAHTCDVRGAVAIDGLPAGPVELAVSSPGYVASDEVASVVAGVRTPVSLKLSSDTQTAPARLTGLVRSAATGEPLAAQLEIVERKSRAAAAPDGTFRLELPSGSYTVVIAAPGHLQQTKKVTVSASDRAIFNVLLHPR